MPPYVRTYGHEVVDFMDQIGRPLDPWQAAIVVDAFGVRQDDLWAAFELLVLVARQNGKGGVTEAIELGGVFLFREPLILHSAHQFKALDVDTPILTTAGWSTMGLLRDGDEVFAPDGQPTKVVAAHPVRTGRPCYRLRFDDGQEIVADAEHLWEVVDADARRVLTTQQLVDEGVSTTVQRVGRPRRTYRFRVDLPAPIEQPAVELPVDPWLLGAWLGDGTTTKGELTVGAEDLSYLRKRLDDLGEDYRVRPDSRWPDRVFTLVIRGLATRLRAAGVLGAKHIPDAYLLASEEQRRELLAGVMDTDGTVSSEQIAVTMVNARLMDDVASLVRSLGYKASLREFRARLAGADAGPMYRVQFSRCQASSPFGMPRKSAKVKPRQAGRTRAHYNAIVAIDPVESRPTRCITVAHESSLYVVGRGFVPTHNTSTAAFRRLQDIIDASDWLTKRVKMISRSKGDESIELTRAAGGGRIQFVARTLGSGRGLTGSKTVFDEAYALTIGQYAAQTPTLATLPNPQIIYTSTPPDDDTGPMPEDAMLPSVRARGLEGGPRIAMYEWSPPPRFDRTDPNVWWECNPALGIRIKDWFLEQQLAAFTQAGRPQKFDTEHLGLWHDVGDLGWTAFKEPDWKAAQDPGSELVGNPVYCIETSRDLTMISIVAAGERKDGMRHVELVDRFPTDIGKLIGGMKKRIEKFEPFAIVIDPAGPAGYLINDVQKHCDVDVVTPSSRAVAAACGRLYVGISSSDPESRDVRVRPHPSLDAAARAAVWRDRGDAKIFDRRNETAPDVAPIMAAALADWGFNEEASAVWAFTD